MNPLTRAALTMRTSRRLGLRNVAVVARHRVASRLGWYAKPASHVAEAGPLFADARLAPPPLTDPDATIARATRIARGELQIFGDRWIELGSPYRWNENVLPVHAGGTDIKGVWEASRFGWAVDLARAHRLEPGRGFLACLEAYAADWLVHHRDYRAANWACGQEAAIRVLHLLLAHHVLGGEAVTPAMASLVAAHLERIARSLGYALAQQNNHATSEAAALFVGGGVLASVPAFADDGLRWQALGRRTLERTVADLVMSDGGFAQYSVNYHRLLLDTLSQIELWRRRLDAPAFSETYGERCRAATAWLGALTNPATGAAPNLGSNDGAQVYRLTDSAYADHRPSLTLAAALFLDTFPAPGSRDAEALFWTGLTPPVAQGANLTGKRTRLFPDFGLALLNPDPAGRGHYAFVRFPVRRFRPGQADALHLDLWSEAGENLLHDAGTFSYSNPRGLGFSSVRAHNAIEFDDGEPMRRIGRFLYADWPQSDVSEPFERGDGVRWDALVVDYRGCRHRRDIHATRERWTIEDAITGFRRRATLRWHLPEQEVALVGNRLETRDFVLTVASPALLAVRVETALVSHTYGRTDPALTLVVDAPAGTERLTTVIEIKAAR